MLNNINAQNINNNNILAAKKLEAKTDTKRSIVLQAPDYLPKYSINQKIEEADQFRKRVINSNYKLNKRKKDTKKIIISIATTLLGIFALKNCKSSKTNL